MALSDDIEFIAGTKRPVTFAMMKAGTLPDSLRILAVSVGGTVSWGDIRTGVLPDSVQLVTTRGGYEVTVGKIRAEIDPDPDPGPEPAQWVSATMVAATVEGGVGFVAGVAGSMEPEPNADYPLESLVQGETEIEAVFTGDVTSDLTGSPLQTGDDTHAQASINFAEGKTTVTYTSAGELVDDASYLVTFHTE